MTKSKPTDVLVKLVDLLTPLSSEERSRVIRAALTMLGDETGDPSSSGTSTSSRKGQDSIDAPARVKAWLRQNDLTGDQLSEVFHISNGSAEIIASEIPGKNGKEKTLNAYLLAGVAAFVASGESKFDDKSARTACKKLGCLNDTNHASYLKDKGNEFTGSKSTGWLVTAPGLKRAAILIKEITKTA